MFSSASSTSARASTTGAASHDRATRFRRLDRAVARALVVALLAMTPLPASAGKEFNDANNTTFDDSTVVLDNSQAGQTTFSIDTNRTTIGWQDLQQPEGNTLEFNFTNPNSIVLNSIGAQHPSNLNGTVISNGTVAFANPFGIFIGDNAVINVGDLIAIGANVPGGDFMASEAMSLALTGTVENNGLIRAEGNISLFGSHVVNNGEIVSENGYVFALAGQHLELQDWDALTSDFLAPKNFFGILSEGTVENHGSIAAPNAALFGGRVLNFGEIEIDNGSLLMVGADAVWVTEFDNPVLIKLPNFEPAAEETSDGESQSAEYAIENHGRIDAGLGHVRLAASDPLGFAIRQGTGNTGNGPASISARRIEIEGGETGRVHLAGTIDASNLSRKGTGGEIDITGSVIALADATIQASGTRGGGTIQIGGEQEGRGELQRANVVLVDENSEIRADAIRRGDGGTVIVFAEDLTSVDGDISARGGRKGGDGGFVETSGLRNFHISRTPDLSARRGAAGSWLIDPFNIRIVAITPGCPEEGDACLDKSIETILSPDFDPTGFDGILRTVNPDDNVPNANDVTADLIAQALGVGTNVTLSTQAFGLDPGTEDGDIDILYPILINSSQVLEGTTATFTLLAARDINVDNNIEVLRTSAGRSNLSLTVDLRANDASQAESDRRFGTDLLEGDVLLNADIITGGGDVTLSGSSVVQQAGRIIDTDGGRVEIRSGSVDSFGLPITWNRGRNDPAIADPTPAPVIEIAGAIDTSDGPNSGGNVVLVASSLSVNTSSEGNTLDIVTGRLSVLQSATIDSGGGDITLSGGNPPSVAGDNFAGSVDIAGDIDSAGGNVEIVANHVDPNGDTKPFDITFIDNGFGVGGELDEGGAIMIASNITTEGGALSIGNDRTQSIQVDGVFDTTQSDTTENGIVRFVAPDSASVDTGNDQYGFGEIRIGTIDAAGTTISSSSVEIEARDVTFSVAGAANPVVITASGSSTAVAPELPITAVTPDALSRGEVRITGNRQLTFHQNTEITGEAIGIVAAPIPTELNVDDTSGLDERADSELRLVFGGTSGAGQPASDGVRLNADLITISVGDGTTPSDDLFSEDLGTSQTPTDFGLQRLTEASYHGLQLRDTSSALRPEGILISQDADFTITSAAPPLANAGELDLDGAFGGTDIGTEGMRITLESSDGVLTIEDAVALNDTAVVPNSDEGKSFVVLNGGLFLPDLLTVPTFVDDTVVFGDGVVALGSGGTTAFDVESLIISTPGDFTIRQQVVDSISSANELIFEAGRDTGVDSAAGRGTLRVDGGITIQADDRLALLAGASGFGDLFFAGSSTTLAANDLDLRAGGGINSQNPDNNAQSRITGLQANVTIQDANGATFGDMASTSTSFSYRQDAAIDAETDLPTLDQFGLDPATGFRTTGDVEYKVRSDQSNIDLDDGIVGTDEGDRFRNSALSLVGLDLPDDPAIVVSDEFTFVGKRIELGGIADFRFTQRLATAFNRSGTDADEEITLRAGLDVSGNLTFDAGGQGTVLVKAPRINLIAGAGLDNTGDLVFESKIRLGDAEFDLSGPVGSTQTFLYQSNALISLNDLPDKDQFIGGNAGLPDILAIRSDLGALDFSDFVVADLPIDLIDDPGRLVLEADSITLSQTDGDNLELTSIDNLNLRLRTNNLTLIAADSNFEDAADAQVLIGARASDVQPLAGVDSILDTESLLIEAFTPVEIATVENSSAASEDPDIPGQFDLGQDQDIDPNANPDQGRGPTTIVIQQDGPVTPNTIFNRNAVSGRLRRTIDEDEDDLAIASVYTLQSFVDSVTIEPENVNGSSLLLNGTGIDLLGGIDPLAEGIIFELGTGMAPGVFDLKNLSALTESSIVIKDGTQISAEDTLAIAVGIVSVIEDDPGTDFGSLSFDGGGATTSLSANRINLTAGPSFELGKLIPNSGGEREPIVDDLPEIDFTNLDEIILTGDPEDSLISITQSASLDSARGGPGDYLTPIEAGLPVGMMWELLQLDVIQGDLIDLTQGDLIVNDIDDLRMVTRGLIARTANLDATLIVNMPDGSATPLISPFATFGDTVEFQSNDLTFVSEDPNTALHLATDNLVLGSSIPDNDQFDDDQLDRLQSDPTSLDRPIVRIQQAADFSGTELPRPNQYVVVTAFGGRVIRFDLNEIDIELKLTTDVATLTFDDDLRARVTGSNLILDSAGDVDIMLDGPTPGYAGLDYAVLQLNTLDVISGDDSSGGTVGDGVITIRPFMISAEPLTIETTGDQRFAGTLALETTLSTTGRNIRFAGDVTQIATPDAGLRVATSGKVIFEADIGGITPLEFLNHLWITYDNDVKGSTPNVEFGRRTDDDGDGIFETPVDENQNIWVLEDILFGAYSFSDGDLSSEIENENDGIGAVGSLSELADLLQDLGLSRKRSADIATIGKALGDLSFNSSNGDFIMASGEKLSVGGTTTITVDANDGLASLGDVSTLVLDVVASEIGLVRRDSGEVRNPSGRLRPDPGSSIAANTINFNGITPERIGPGRGVRFGVPNPFDTANLPSFLNKFPLFELKPDGSPFVAEDFRFDLNSGNLADQIPILRPLGSSRSDLSGAFGPKVEPILGIQLTETLELTDPDRLLEMAIDAHTTPESVRVARLENVAVIDDLRLPWEEDTVAITIARLDSDYADAAVELYEELFDRDGNRATEVREILQDALDRYLANTRARRVFGFELRRFVKNRPSTLLDAYQALESLDALFRYHRRLGLSPGEYRRIQRGWLRRIQPDGITLDELSEAIHPSRYVRGSDILDIFGR